MSFSRADYLWLTAMARQMYAISITAERRDRELLRGMAKDLFERVENVIGQQSPPLGK